MDARNDMREFLISRRREDVALLAGISAEYYVRLERGNMRGVSEDVLDSIARALRVDEAERMHLFDLARVVNATPSRRGGRLPTQERVRPAVQRILDSLVGVPAFVRNERFDVLAANQVGEAFYAPLFDDPVRPVPEARSSASAGRPTT